MDKKKTLISELVATCLLMAMSISLFAQNIKEIRFGDKKYEYSVGNDSLTL